MRRTVVMVALAWCVGLCTAGGAAYGYALLDAWQGYGEQFQLGYIVGYFDALTLARRHDQRMFIPLSGMPNFERWRGLVNDFYADPKNAKRPLPDAMAAAGKIVQDEITKAYAERVGRAKKATPAPSAAVPDASDPTTIPR